MGKRRTGGQAAIRKKIKSYIGTKEDLSKDLKM